MKLRSLVLQSLCFVICLCAQGGQLRAAEVLNEAQVKAAVVYNLLQFVSWPRAGGSEGSDFVLCLPEENLLLQQLQRFRGRPINAQNLVVRAVPLNLDALLGCQAIYIESGDPALLLRVSAMVSGHAVLTIGEGTGAITRGAMIGIANDAGKLSFSVDLAATRRNGLKVSSKLLALARQVLE